MKIRGKFYIIIRSFNFPYIQNFTHSGSSFILLWVLFLLSILRYYIFRNDQMFVSNSQESIFPQLFPTCGITDYVKKNNYKESFPRSLTLIMNYTDYWSLVAVKGNCSLIIVILDQIKRNWGSSFLPPRPTYFLSFSGEILHSFKIISICGNMNYKFISCNYDPYLLKAYVSKKYINPKYFVSS